MPELVLFRTAKRLSAEFGYSPLQLREAVPYIKAFQHKVMVVKVGGSVLHQADSRASFIEDITFMAHIGMRVIPVHGGSRHLNARMRQRGIEPRFERGQRYTNRETLPLAIEVFNELNAELVAALKAAGAKALGFPADAAGATLIQAARKGADPENFVGNVTGVDRQRLQALEDDCIPVIACIGSSQSELFNINADEVAGYIAQAYPAEKLILLTDVDGVGNASGQLISSLTAREANDLIDQKVIVGGMIPKVHVCLNALRAGVRKAHVINGATKDSLLGEVLTDRGVGTEIVGSTGC